jgi:hypothetical protein
MKLFNGNNFLIKYLGIIFIIAGIIRIFLLKDRKNELHNMNLPNGTDCIIIMFEIICGFILFFNLADISITLLILLLFLTIGSLLIIYNNFDNLLKEINTVWTFQPSMMSLTFHFTYIIMIIGIYLNLKRCAFCIPEDLKMS